MACTQATNSQIKSDSKKSDSIQLILTKVVNDGKAPGMIAAIISGEGVRDIASAGERKAGSGIAFTTNDVVHIGSCGKAMTATMIATLVAEGKLSWDTKLIEAILERKYLDKLIEPVEFYASGWFVAEHAWAQGITINHGGCNDIWYAIVLVAPKLDRAFVVSTNSLSLDSTPGICTEIMNRLIRMELDLDTH